MKQSLENDIINVNKSPDNSRERYKSDVEKIRVINTCEDYLYKS